MISLDNSNYHIKCFSQMKQYKIGDLTKINLAIEKENTIATRIYTIEPSITASSVEIVGLGGYYITREMSMSSRLLYLHGGKICPKRAFKYVLRLPTV